MANVNKDTFSEICSSKPYLSVVDRYFLKRYKTDVKRKAGEDLCILEHSNRICIVTLAESHPICRLKLKVTKVDFQVDEKSNRLDNKVSGKAKRGAQMISELSPLCHISCDNDEVYTVYGCIRASLVEVNERLVANPQLVVTNPSMEGYIAVLLTRHTDHDREIAKLLTETNYKLVLEKRIKESQVDTMAPTKDLDRETAKLPTETDHKSLLEKRDKDSQVDTNASEEGLLKKCNRPKADNVESMQVG